MITPRHGSVVGVGATVVVVVVSGIVVVVSGTVVVVSGTVVVGPAVLGGVDGGLASVDVGDGAVELVVDGAQNGRLGWRSTAWRRSATAAVCGSAWRRRW
jgi:hypothetical protein